MKPAKVILDSGAYTAWTKGAVIDIDQYIEFIRKYGHVFTGGAFTLDVIGDGKRSYQNWKKMQRAGVETIPVFHLGSDEKWLQKYMKQTDYIGIGAIANLNTKYRLLGLDYIWKKYLLDNKGKPKVKVHGLGLTALGIMTRYAWYSVDSMTALKMAAYGGVIVPRLQIANGAFSYDIQQADKLTVSSARSADPSVMNYHFLTPSIKEAYKKYFQEKGYQVGELTGQVRHVSRKEKKKRKGKKQPVYNPLIPDTILEIEKVEQSTLMNNWFQRYQANLDFWLEFQRERRTPYIYHVISGTNQIGPVTKRNLPFLVSYFLLMDQGALFQEIMKVRGKNVEKDKVGTNSQQKVGIGRKTN